MVYGTRPNRWVYSECTASDVIRAPRAYEIGRSRMAWDGDVLDIRLDERCKHIGLDHLGLPLRGRVRVHPEHLTGMARPIDVAGEHHWWPVAPVSRVEVELGSPDLRFQGTAYHDANWGDAPLESGFRSWNWSRAELDAGTAVLYDCVLPDGSLHEWGRLIRRDGRIEGFEPARRVDLGAGKWRVDRATRTDPSGEASVRQSLEDTPFYTRSMLDTTLAGERAVAMHESIDFERFDSRWVQYLITHRMRRKF